MIHEAPNSIIVYKRLDFKATTNLCTCKENFQLFVQGLEIN